MLINSVKAKMDQITSVTPDGCILGLGDVYSHVEVKEENREEVEVEPDLNVFISDGLYNISYAPTEVTEVHTCEEQHQCNICEKRFPNINNLIEHHKTHTGEKSYQCSHCDKRFTCMPILERHMAVHSEEKLYQSKYCDKHVDQKNSLDQLKITHTGEKPYQCNYCDEYFVRECNLEAHQKSHIEEKPYQCRHCNKYFTRMYTLEELQEIHNGEKVYKCNDCDECFTNKIILTSQQKILTDEKLHEGNQYNKGLEQKKIKRKHVGLTLEKKIELLKRLEKKEKLNVLMADYNVGRSTIYEIKKNLHKILKEQERCESKDVLRRRKNMHSSRNIELDNVLYEWVKQKRSEGALLNDLAIKNQAQRFNDQINCGYRTKPLQFSNGWLARFKARYGLTRISTPEESFSTDPRGAENYIDEFEKFRNDNNLTDEQIFNCNKTGLFWNFIGEKNLPIHIENTPGAFTDNKDMLTVLACANQAGTFKNKLAVIGKSNNFFGLKEARIPVNWYSSKNAFMTEEIFTNWITNEFLPDARKHLVRVGLDSTCKIVLTLDNCSAHPSAEYLENLDVHKQLIVKTLPPNVTSLIQPMEQGILRSLKVRYKFKLMTSMIESLNKGQNVMSFLKNYNIFRAMYALHSAWLDIAQSTLKNGWNKLCPNLKGLGIESVHLEAQEPYQGFETQSSEEQQMLTELLEYNSKTFAMTNVAISQEDIIEVMDADRNVPIVQTLSDDEILQSLLKVNKVAQNDHYYGQKTDFNSQEDIPLYELIDMCDKLLIGIQKMNCIPDDDVMGIFRVKEHLAKRSMGQWLKTNMET